MYNEFEFSNNLVYDRDHENVRLPREIQFNIPSDYSLPYLQSNPVSDDNWVVNPI
jgi:hypothetical protein